MSLVIITGLFGMGVFTFASSIAYYFHITAEDSKGGGGSRRRAIHQAKLDKAKKERMG